MLVRPANINEKREYKIEGTDVELMIENKFNENLRERNPVSAIVTAVPDGYTECSIGDAVWVNHFTFLDHSNRKEYSVKNGGFDHYRVEIREVFCKVIGGELIPLNDYFFTEVIVDNTEDVSGFSLPEFMKNKALRDRVRVSIPNPIHNKHNLKSGDVIHILKNADYLIKIMGKEYARVRESEINAILN